MNTPTRTCTVCGQTFPATAEFFYRDRKRLRSKCKSCYQAAQREHYYANLEKYRKRDRKWKENHADQVRAYMANYAQEHAAELRKYRRRYYQENKEAIKIQQRNYVRQHRDERNAYKRRWRANNRTRIQEHERNYRNSKRPHFREISRRWRQSHPQEKLADTRKRRARLRQTDGNHTAADIQRQYDLQQGCCYWCSQPTHNHFHVDHVIPLARGGSNNPENLVIACRVCNQSKSDKLPYIEWTPPNPLKLVVKQD